MNYWQKKIYFGGKKALAEKEILLAEKKALAEKEIFLAEKKTWRKKRDFWRKKRDFWRKIRFCDNEYSSHKIEFPIEFPVRYFRTISANPKFRNLRQ